MKTVIPHQARVLVLGQEDQIAFVRQSRPDPPPYRLKTTQHLDEAKSLLRDHVFDAAIIYEGGSVSFPSPPSLFPDANAVSVPYIWIAAEPDLDTALEAVNNNLFRYLPGSISGQRLNEEVQSAIQWSRFKRLVDWSENRLTPVAERLQNMKKAISESPIRRPSEQLIDAFFELIFERVIDGYLDAKQLLFILTQDNAEALELSLRHDPVRRHLIEAVEEAVDVIASTKHQFRSQRLAQVRKELEAALQKARNVDGTLGPV